MYREASWFTVHGSQRVRHNWVTYTFCFTLCPWMFSSVSYFTVYGNLNRIFILLLCENCINLNYIELCFSGQLYPSTSLLIFLLSTFEFNIETQTKIFNLSTEKNNAIYSRTICNLALYFPTLPEMCFHTFIIQEKVKKKSKTL